MMALLARILPLLAKGLSKTNGKKTVTGALLTATGAGMLFVPGLDEYAIETIIGGVTVLAGGATHKVIKKRKGGK